MIDGHEKFRLKDMSGKNDLLIEVNWNPDNPEQNECKVLKFTYPDGKTAVVKKEYLMSVLFAIGNEAEQKKMIPQRVSRSRWYETIISVKATKDIRKGESMTFPLKITLPSEEEEIVGSLSKDVLEGRKIIVPKA